MPLTPDQLEIRALKKRITRIEAEKSVVNYIIGYYSKLGLTVITGD